MSVDNTHTKYLSGKDKAISENYKKAAEAYSGFESFGAALGAGLKDGEEIDIPVNGGNG